VFIPHDRGLEESIMRDAIQRTPEDVHDATPSHASSFRLDQTVAKQVVACRNLPRPDPGIFYGWVVVAAAFAVTFVGFGSAYTFSAFVESLQRDFAASRGSVALVFSLAGFLYFGLGIVSGPLADRWGSRRLAVVGMILRRPPRNPSTVSEVGVRGCGRTAPLPHPCGGPASSFEGRSDRRSGA
jgi:hypothetical protein